MSGFDKRLGKPPAFQVYAGLELADLALQSAGLAADGLIHRMRCSFFLNRELPDDPALVARAIGASEEEVRASFHFARSYFSRSSTGMLICPEMDRQRANQEDKRSSLSKNARRTNEMRWGPDGTTSRSANRSANRSGVEESGVELKGGEQKEEDKKQGCTREEYMAAKNGIDEWVDEYRRYEERLGRDS